MNIYKLNGMVCMAILSLLLSLTSCKDVYVFKKADPSEKFIGSGKLDTAIVQARFQSFDSIYNLKQPFDLRFFPRYEIVSVEEVLKMLKAGQKNDPKYIIIRNGYQYSGNSDSISTYLYMLDKDFKPVKSSPVYVLDDMQRCPIHCPEDAEKITF